MLREKTLCGPRPAMRPYSLAPSQATPHRGRTQSTTRLQAAARSPPRVRLNPPSNRHRFHPTESRDTPAFPSTAPDSATVPVLARHPYIGLTAIPFSRAPATYLERRPGRPTDAAGAP